MSSKFNLVKKAEVIFILLTIIIAFSCSNESKKYAPLNAGDPIPFMEKAITGILPNGLTYYLLENKKPEDRAYLTLAVHAGSIFEEDDEQGLMHFVEHMAFNGTERFPESDLIEYLRSLGMRFGADVNAFTSFDRTVYGIEVPVEKSGDGVKRIPEKALDIISDWTNKILFLQKDVVEERAIIMEEYRTRLGANNRLMRDLLKLIAAGSVYADRLPIGKPEVIQAASSDKLKNLYKNWYVPENMAVIIVGDFDAANLENNLAAIFTGDKSEDFVLPEITVPPPQKGSQKVQAFVDPELTLININLFYKQLLIPQENNIKHYRDDLINTLIDNILYERIKDKSLDPQAPFVNVSAGFFNLISESPYYEMSVVPKAGRTEEALAELLKIKEAAFRYGFLNPELDRAKRAMLSNFERHNNETEKEPSERFINYFTDNFLDDDYITDNAWELETAKALLPNIKLKDLHEQFKSYFEFDDLAVFVSAPETERELLPSSEQIIEIIQNSKKQKVERPKEKKMEKGLLDKVPASGSILNESIDEDTGILSWKLSNGAQVLIQKTDNQNDQIVLYAIAKGGTYNVSPEDDTSASMASEIMSLSGMGKWNLTELEKILADKQATFSFDPSGFLRTLQGNSTNKDLKTLFEMLYLTFTEPRLDQSSVDLIKDKYKTILAQRLENPDAYFSDELSKYLYNNDPRFAPMNLESLDKIHLAPAKSFIEKCTNPSDWTFVFTGNIDIDEFLPLAETYIASIPEKEHFNTWPDITITRPQSDTKSIVKGKEDKSTAFSGRFVPKTFNEKDAMTAYILSGYLDILLTQEIREKLGGVYSIYVNINLSPLPVDGELSLNIVYNCDPARVEELNKAIEAQLVRAANGNINTDTFNKAVSSEIRDFETSLENNYYLSNRFGNYAVLFELPIKNFYGRVDIFNSVRQSDIQNLLKELLTQGAFNLTMYPEGK
ncbi:peptidase M16 [Spirochaetia bacterium]|nr:peptidase M16 [Spirochaetia bacterium]